MKIEPGDLCRVLPGGVHGWTGCRCMDDRFVVVTIQSPIDPTTWLFKEPESCRTGDIICTASIDKFLQPIRPTPESIAWEREHEMPSEARKTELDNARWVVEKA